MKVSLMNNSYIAYADQHANSVQDRFDDTHSMLHADIHQCDRPTAHSNDSAFNRIMRFIVNGLAKFFPEQVRSICVAIGTKSASKATAKKILTSRFFWGLVIQVIAILACRKTTENNAESHGYDSSYAGLKKARRGQFKKLYEKTLSENEKSFMKKDYAISSIFTIVLMVGHAMCWKKD